MRKLLSFTTALILTACWNFNSLTSDTDCSSPTTVAEQGQCVQRCVDASAKPVRCVLFSGGLVRYFVEGSDDGTLSVGLLPSACSLSGGVAKVAPTVLRLRRRDVAVGLQGTLCDTGGDVFANMRPYYAAE